MVGIEVGATRITVSSGESIPLDQELIPPDLLRRVADDTPYVWLNGDGHGLSPAWDVYAVAIADALRAHRLEERDEFPIGVAVPGGWAPRALSQVSAALAARGIDAVLLNDAEAAVAGYRTSGTRLPESVAVVGLRATQVSVVVVGGCDRDRPVALPSPTLVHDEGAERLDAAVLQHLIRGLADLGERVDVSDPEVLAAARGALEQCRRLRESLSTSARESELLDLPGVGHRVLLTRSELEELARPWADAVVGVLRMTLEQCVRPVGAVLLTGGPAAMPLISQRVSADLALEVHVPEQPSLVVARGAARLLAERRLPERRARGLWDTVKRRALGFSPAPGRLGSVAGSGAFDGGALLAFEDELAAARDVPGPEAARQAKPVQQTKPVQQGKLVHW